MDIGVPIGFLGSVATSSTEAIGELSPVIVLICGLLLAILVVEILITNLTGKTDTLE